MARGRLLLGTIKSMEQAARAAHRRRTMTNETRTAEVSKESGDTVTVTFEHAVGLADGRTFEAGTQGEIPSDVADKLREEGLVSDRDVEEVQEEMAETQAANEVRRPPGAENVGTPRPVTSQTATGAYPAEGSEGTASAARSSAQPGGPTAPPQDAEARERAAGGKQPKRE